MFYMIPVILKKGLQKIQVPTEPGHLSLSSR